MSKPSLTLGTPDIEEVPVGNYFTSNSKKSLEFIPTGCHLLDLSIGGGWPLGKVSNTCGDYSSGKCVKNAYISSEKGMELIDTIGEHRPYGQSGYDTELFVKNDETDTVTHFWKEEVEITKKIVVKKGFELEATLDHKIMIWTPDCEFKMVPFKDLQIGDCAVLSKAENQFTESYWELEQKSYRGINDHNSFEIKVPEKLDASLASLMGLFLADGCVGGHTVQFTSGKKWFKNELYRTVEKLQPDNSTMCLIKDRSEVRDVSHYNIRTKQIFSFFQDLFGHSLVSFTARKKYIPDCILQSPKDVQAALLKSLMTADSWVKESGEFIEYYTASEQMAKQVQLMLLHFGVVALRSVKTNVKGYEGHAYQTITISGRDLKKFIEEIGSFKTIKVKYKGGNSDNAGGKNAIPYLRKHLIEKLKGWREDLGWRKSGKLDKVPGKRIIGIKCCFTGCEFTAETVTPFLLRLLDPAVAKIVDVSRYLELTNPNLIFAPIKEIELNQQTTNVFDVYIPKNHLFWCNGFISHNSLLSIEAMTNFHMKWPNGHIFYLEAEAGFDVEYAEAMGLPAHAVNFVGDEVLKDFTIESWYEHISEILSDKSLQNEPMLYIVDSLDAMSDRAEVGRDITDGSYNMTKQKKLGELFRRLTKQVEKSRLHLQIVSQLRENIGAFAGKKFRRSGGKALDFYASQVLWLTRKKQIKKTKNKVERVVGVEISTNCEKNKVSMPFRKSDFKILFGFGIDDEQSMLEWLQTIEALKEYKDPFNNAEVKSIDAYLRKYKNLDKSDRNKVHCALAKLVTEKWFEIEKSFLPTFSKY